MINSPSGWLSDYLAYTDHFHYPRHWNLACGMLALGLATGAAVYGIHGAHEYRPLPLVMLIGDSGSGKGSCIKLMHRVLDEARPDQITVRDEGTPAGILNRIVDGKTFLIEAGEMTTMFNRMDFMANFVPFLTQLSDQNGYGPKALKDRVYQFSQIRTCFLFGSNERAIREHFNSSIIEEGLASRLIWLYSDIVNEPEEPVPSDDPSVLRARAKAVEGLVLASAMAGKASLSAPSKAWYLAWHRANRNHRAEDVSRQGYYERRHYHMLRTALLAAISRGSLEISTEDLEWAWAWQGKVEADMFRIYNSLEMSKTGRDEERVLGWIKKQSDWIPGYRVKQRFHSQMKGAQHVQYILDSLNESHRLAKEPMESGRGNRYKVMESE